MGIKTFGLADALFTKTKQSILALLFINSESDFHTNDIIRQTKMGSGSIQRELEKLSQAGLVNVKKVGNQKRYQANQLSPLFSELRSLIIKSSGLADVIKGALMPIYDTIQFAFIYGSIAKKTDRASSDIDLLLIGNDLTYAECFRLLEPIETQLMRKINPSFYDPTQWKDKVSKGNHFITSILKQPKIFLKGNEDELNKFR